MKKKVNKGKNKEKKVHVHVFVLLIGQTVNIQWQIWGSALGPHHRVQENIFRPDLFNSTVVSRWGLLPV